MPRKCRRCGLKIIEYPIYKGQEEGEPFLKGITPKEKLKSLFRLETWKKDWNWRNLIIGDWTKMIILISILFVAWAYTYDSAAYREIYANPCDYVKNNIDACLELEKQGKQVQLNPNLAITEIPTINIPIEND